MPLPQQLASGELDMHDGDLLPLFNGFFFLGCQDLTQAEMQYKLEIAGYLGTVGIGHVFAGNVIPKILTFSSDRPKENKTLTLTKQS